MSKIKFLSLLAMALLVFACGKDDDDNGLDVAELSNLQYTGSSAMLTVSWDAFEGAMMYVVYVDDLYATDGMETSVMLGDLEDGAVITIEAYADFDEEILIAKGEITFDASNAGGSGEGSGEVGEVSNLSLSENHGMVTLLWDAYTGAKSYMVFVGDEAVSTIPISGNSHVFNDLEDGAELTVKAYSDPEITDLIAEGTITYSAE
ncbi:hypothetical protein ACT29H_02770 [Thermophagus sp. OGC60D27]|uniref:hypothetical protein n=1 Tax=Thermophagus sp. OGC60D27 TaxID=3458415 RepID=UPI0040384AC8